MNEQRTYVMSARADGVNKTRERVLVSATELFFAQDYDSVTLNGIAAAAGVSHQTVLNHFESKEGVVRAIAERLKAEVIEVRYAATPNDVRAAVRVLIDDYEVHGDANARWAATAARLGTLAQMLTDARIEHQRWIAHMFADSLPASLVDRRRAIHAVHVATDVYSWKLLRRDLGLSRHDTELVIGDLVEAALAAATATRTTATRTTATRTTASTRKQAP